MGLKPKVIILTSSHKANDDRIFHKQAKSIARAGYDTTIIAPHPADETVDSIRIKAVPDRGGKIFGKIFFRPLFVLMAGLKEKGDIYHFHDPELLIGGFLLKLMGKKVVYDAHEYYKQNILSKRSLPWGLKHIIAYGYDLLEIIAARIFDGVIVVDRLMSEKYKGRAEIISNYPYKPEKLPARKERGDEFRCVYAGGLSKDRGLFKMIEAMKFVKRPARLILLGPLSDDDRAEAEKLEGFEKVDYLGFRPWPEVLKLLPECHLGLVLLQPVPAYILAGEGTVKLYEYMASGLPVLGSDFVNLDRIIRETGCGMTVDPTDPEKIAGMITFFAENPDAAAKMGENGVRAVMEKYNWGKEEEKLLSLYGRILSGRELRRHSYA